MRGLFSIDSPLMRFLGRVGDLMILNILFLVTSIPIITLGASLTALHYAVYKMVCCSDTSAARDFFHSFRQNFRQATVLWLLLMLFGFLLWYDLRSVWGQTGLIQTAVKLMSLVACAAMAMLLLYVFAVLARFDNTVRGTLKNAVGLALRHPGRTVSMFMLPFACGVLTFYTYSTIRWGMLAWLLIGFAAIAYFNSFPLRKTFDEAVELSGGIDVGEEPEL